MLVTAAHIHATLHHSASADFQLQLTMHVFKVINFIHNIVIHSMKSARSTDSLMYLLSNTDICETTMLHEVSEKWHSTVYFFVKYNQKF